MNRILILFAHPGFDKSKTNRTLLSGVEQIKGVALHDLYEEYPDFNIDIELEKQLLTDHDIIVWHFPFHMYSAPAMLRQWIDLVLEYGWAHGGRENALTGKSVFIALTAGGTRKSYAPGQYNQHTVPEFLIPFKQTAALCKMTYLPPFVIHGTHLLTDRQLVRQAELYHQLLAKMVAGSFSAESLSRYEYLNDWLAGEERAT
jgi:glutathione-regulated potassium-efflux system ancillary protein KefG